MRRIIPALVCLVALGQAAEPFAVWDRARQDPFRMRLDDFTYRVLHPGDDLVIRIGRSRSLLKQVQVLEEAGRIAATDALMAEAVAVSLGYLTIWQAWFRNIRDERILAWNLMERQLMVERGWHAVPDGTRKTYLDLAGQQDLEGMAKLLADGNHPFADHLLVAHARMTADPQTLREVLRQLETRFPDSPKREEVAYALACNPTALGAALDPLAADAAIRAYLTAYPAGRWRFQARGWQAFLRVQFPDRDWQVPGGGLVAAARIYEELLLEPDCGGMFRDLVGSLRSVWPRLAMDDGPSVTEPQLVLIWAHHLLTDRDAKAQAALTVADRAMLGVTDTHLRCCYAQLLVQADQGAAAAAVLADIPDDGTAFLDYLRGRLYASQDDVAGAADRFERLTARKDDAWAAPLARELGGRIGGACERTGRWDEALAWYRKVGDDWNTLVCVGGEMPLDDLLRWLVAHPQWAAPGRDGHADRDLLPDIRTETAGRLLAAGRLQEAGALVLDPAAAKAIAELIALDAKARTGQAADLYALGAFWYKQGQALLMNQGSHWGRWYFWTWPKPELEGEGVDPALRQRWAEREDLYVNRNACIKAQPLFARVAEEATEPDLAAKALYSAGLCCWWLRGSNQQSFTGRYWAHQNREGEFSQLGDAFMADLVARYPGHSLAQITFARDAAQRLGKQKL